MNATSNYARFGSGGLLIEKSNGIQMTNIKCESNSAYEHAGGMMVK